MYKPLKAIFYRDLFEDCLPQIFDEIFIKNVYQPYFNGKKDLTVLDVGANIGLFTLYAYPFSKKIYAIEPATDHFETLNKFVEFNKMDRVTTIKKAISSKDGEAELYHCLNTTMHSLFKPLVDQFNQDYEKAYNRKHEDMEIEKVPTVTLATLFKEQNIDQVDFLKLDVEGEEAKIFSHSSFEEVATKIKTVFTEVHTWNESNINIVRSSFIDRGFSVNKVNYEATSLIVAQRL